MTKEYICFDGMFDAVQMGKVIVYFPDCMVHISTKLKTTSTKDGKFIVIMGDKCLEVQFEDGDYWIDPKEVNDAKEV